MNRVININNNESTKESQNFYTENFPGVAYFEEIFVDIPGETPGENPAEFLLNFQEVSTIP